MECLETPDFLQLNVPMLDVRAPSEYAKGHIPGAVSFPLFTDKERAQVGIAYKKIGKKAATKLGLSIVGPKMKAFVEKAEELKSDTLSIYCWRGGMRSSSMGWLLEQYGLNVLLLNKGYKAFRNYILDYFKRPFKIKVLTGLTGSGKTHVLKAMRKQGVQVIDLEGLANHPGSSFGNQLSTGQPTTETFQNNLFQELYTYDTQKPIWIEDESLCIGKVHLPEEFFETMTQSPHYRLNVANDDRIKLLVKEYGELTEEQLLAATEAIQKKLGNKETKEAKAHITARNLAAAAELVLTYYDRQYRKNVKRLNNEHLYEIDGTSLSHEEIANKIINTYVH